jgi:mannose-6-phosphate isomerase-like protein (cupin superfamily)
MTPSGIQRFIVKPRKIEELVHHDIRKMEEEVGPLFRYMSREMVPEADVTLLVRKIERNPQASDVGPSLHQHVVNQLYCLLGNLEVEVTIEDEKGIVQGPASILIPAGKNHAIRFIAGRGYLVNVLSGASYG